MDYFLTSGRLGFRHWTTEDLPLASALWGDRPVSVWLGGPFSAEAIQKRLAAEIQQQAEHGVQYWPIFLLANHEHVGCAGLRPKTANTFELGYHLKAAFWGQGLATEAASTVVQHAFSVLGVETLFAGHHPRNDPSRKVLGKLGFVYAGDEFYEPSGFVEPTYLLHRHDWCAHRNEHHLNHPQSATAGQA